MPIDRRLLVATGLGLGTVAVASAAEAAGPRRTDVSSPGRGASGTDLDVRPDSGQDVSQALQQAIDRAAERRVALRLAPGRYLARGLKLRPGSRIVGDGQAVLSLSGDGALLVGDGADAIHLDGLAVDGGAHRPSAAGGGQQIGRAHV